jgi:uncharacterized protein YbjT (DUF2867 family)
LKIKAIVFGATGMVGEGVLYEALKHKDVESVLVIGRRACGVKHPKLTEIVHQDFYDYSAIEEKLQGYNACYFCLGVTSIGKNEEDYTRLTYDLTMAAGKTLAKLNPVMIFCYVSGKGTDGSEKGRLMWARVKGKTENDLMKLPFKKVFAFRPGYIKPIKGLRNAFKFSRIIAPFYPVLKLFFRDHVCTLEDLGLAMISVSLKGYKSNILECEDIADAAKNI